MDLNDWMDVSGKYALFCGFLFKFLKLCDANQISTFTPNINDNDTMQLYLRNKNTIIWKYYMVGRIPNGLKSDVSTKKLQIRILPVQ